MPWPTVFREGVEVGAFRLVCRSGAGLWFVECLVCTAMAERTVAGLSNIRAGRSAGRCDVCFEISKMPRKKRSAVA